MMPNKIFIIAASQPWDTESDNDMKTIAREIAAQNSVLYINPPLYDHIVTFSEKQGVLNVGNNSIRQESEDLWIITPPALNIKTSGIYSEDILDILCKGNSVLYANAAIWAMERLGLNWDNSYLLIDNNPFVSCRLQVNLPVKLSILYRNNSCAPLSGALGDIAGIGESAISHADIVITDSADMAAEIRKCNVHTYNIGNGINLKGYKFGATYPRPADIADITTPIIGCAGTASSFYLSASILLQLSLACEDATIVVLGDKDPLIAKHPVHNLPNVRFLGPKSEEELPAYISAFDVCIDPSINRHPNSRYKDHIVNYLALGKVVVCNDQAHVRPFLDYVLVAEYEQEFVEKVFRALSIRMPWSLRYQRAEFAQSFSWSKYVERLYTVIDIFETEQAPRLSSAGR